MADDSARGDTDPGSEADLDEAADWDEAGGADEAAASAGAAGPEEDPDSKLPPSLIWDGDASRGTRIFKRLGRGNCEAPGSLTAVQDAAQGLVWRYNKPASSNRCESHGIVVGNAGYVFRNGSTVFLGWRSKLTRTSNNNANFQWKSYGAGMRQNFPIVMKMISGKMTLMQVQPGGKSTFLWSKAISANTWNHYVLKIAISSALTGGHIEFWFNGVKQSFTTGGQRFNCRTFDAEHVCPKWGVYGASGTAMINYVDGLKVGTTYEAAAQ